jgi:hypothetical protein
MTIVPEGGSQGGEDPYHSSGEIALVLHDISQDHPDIAIYRTASEMLGVRSIPGEREIPILIIGDPDEERPWIMVIGGHHGDEPDSSEVVLAFAKHITDSFSADEEIALSLISRINIAILPVVNPYGLDMGIRYDENGEDPNRDYPFEPSPPSEHSDGIPLTTAGSRTIHELADLFPFSMAISFHTGSKGIFYPWGAPNVGTYTPDNRSFYEIGAMLSRASGKEILHGPANTYSYVANLEGAFDDHLYGSSLLPEHIYSEDMALPWSTFTATIELDTVKGKNPGNLGNLDNLWEQPLTDEGVLPMGVRICYSACEMVSPSLEADLSVNEDYLGIYGTINGAVSVADPIIMVDGEITKYEIEWEGSKFLPEMEFSVMIDNDFEDGIHTISFETTPDQDWLLSTPDAYPDTLPRSLASMSRLDNVLFWETGFEVERSPQDHGNGPSIALSPQELIFEAGGPSSLGLIIDTANETPMEMTILVEIDEWSQTTVFESYEIVNGSYDYYFSSVMLSGKANLTVNLTFVNRSLELVTEVELIPSVDILSVTKIQDREDTWKVLLGIGGGTGPTPIFWAVSRYQYTSWYSDDWAIKPQVEISPGYGPLTILIDLSGYSGKMHFRASSVMVDSYSETYLMDFLVMEPSGGILLTPVHGTIEGDDLIIGPALVISNIDGTEAISPYNTGTNYKVLLRSQTGREDLTMDLYFKERGYMTPEEIDKVADIVGPYGIDISDVPGAWSGSIEDVDLEGTYYIVSRVSGHIYLGDGNDHDFNLEEIMGMIEHDSESDDEEEDHEIPWSIILVMITVGIIILIVTYLRYQNHVLDPEPIGEVEKKQDTRNPATGDRTGRRSKIVGRGEINHPGRRRAERPPWR